MAHFAEVINGSVKRVLVTNDTWTEAQSIAWLKANVANTQWIQCSYNGNMRGVYPGIGYTYSTLLDTFVAPILDLNIEIKL